MKKIIAGLCAAGVLVSAAVVAGDTATIAVTANVVGHCAFNSDGDIDFTLDPSTGGDVNGTVTQPAFWCTKNATWTITDDDGLHASGTTHRMADTTAGTEFIPYTFTYTATGAGLGKTNPITMDIASTVAEADYINASAGGYADTVTLTINP